MEKIIAVVVMIAIVIGLIATAVLPMVNQMNEQGDQANQQLGTLTATMSGDVYTGATVKAEVKSYTAKIGSGEGKITSIKFVPASGSSWTVTEITAAAGVSGVSAVPDNSLFKRDVVKYPSGAIKTITYTEQ